MKPIPIHGAHERGMHGQGSPLLLVVGDAEAMVSGGVVVNRMKVHCHVESATEAMSAVRMLQNGLEPDLVLMDSQQKDIDCLEAISQLRSLNRKLKIVLFSDPANSQVIMRAFRLGTEDVLPRPCDQATFVASMRSHLGAWQESDLRRGSHEAVKKLESGTTFVAASATMQNIRSQAELVATANFPVLCIGERGTGKELIARLLHQLSSRSQQPFVKIDCTTLPDDLADGELFGFEPDSTMGTGAVRLGRFELCGGGTLLLDGFERLSLPLQAKLARALEERRFTRPGGTEKVRLNARIIASTNVEVRLAIEAKSLRRDLCRHLGSFIFQLPPLRERREDIPILLSYYMDIFARRYALQARHISQGLIRRCQEHTWPGNVSELEDFVWRYLFTGVASFDHCGAEGWVVDAEEEMATAQFGGTANLKDSRRQAEAKAIAAALGKTHWNLKAAAGLLSISYSTLLRKLRRYAMDTHAGPSTEQSVRSEAPRNRTASA